mgnify:CR=1 FL=1
MRVGAAFDRLVQKRLQLAARRLVQPVQMHRQAFAVGAGLGGRQVARTARRNGIGVHVAGNALELHWGHRLGGHEVAHMGVGFMAHHDAAGLRRRFQPRREVRLGADDGIIHPRLGAEVADVAIAGVDADAGAEGAVDAAGAPLLFQFRKPLLHLQRHAHAGAGVFGSAQGFRIAEEGHDGIADELVDGGAMPRGNRRHLGEILVEQRRQLFGLQRLGGLGEILDVGKEHRELLTLGRDRGVLLAGENRPVDLR